MCRTDPQTASRCIITDMDKGRIIRIVSNRYEVLCEQGMVSCIAMGKLRKGQTPLVGDLVAVEHFAAQSGIQKLYPRRNQLLRPPVANVDQAIIVMSCRDPDFSTVLIDRLLFQIVYHDIQPLLCVTKTDLIAADDPVYEAIERYRQSGYAVYTSSAQEASPALIAALKGKISVLTGQSGAGKSSLLNRIDPRFHLQTQAISKALGRGKHTTRHCELHEIAQGWVADTPGFSSMDFSYMDIGTLAAKIPDFQPYVHECRFRDCVHMNEPDCALRQAVAAGNVAKERYAHYQEVVTMIKQMKKRY